MERKRSTPQYEKKRTGQQNNRKKEGKHILERTETSTIEKGDPRYSRKISRGPSQ